MASCFSETGAHEGAKNALERALNLSKEVFGEKHEYTVKRMRDLATVLNQLKESTGAAKLLCQALEISLEMSYTMPSDDDSCFECEVLSSLARTLCQLSEDEQAEGLFRQVFFLIEKRRSGYYPDEAICHLNYDLARILLKRHEPEGAETFFRKALEIIDQGFDCSSMVQIYDIMQYIGHALDKQGKYKEAEQVYREALGMLEDASDKNDRSLRQILVGLARSLRHLAQYREAEKTYRQALRLVEEKFSGDVRLRCRLIKHLTNLLFELGEVNEAEELCRKALRIAEESEDCELILNTTVSLSSLLSRRRGNNGEAERYCQQALRLAEGNLSPNLGLMNNLTVRRARILYRLGDYNEAEKLYRKALENVEESADNLRICDLKCELAWSLHQLCKKEEAEKLFREVLSLAEGRLDKKYVLLHRILYGLARSLWLRNDKEAEMFLRQALELAESHDDTRRRCRTMADLALALCEWRRYEEAENICHEALRLGEGKFDKRPHLEEKLRNTLAKAARRQGKKKLAKEILAKGKAKNQTEVWPGLCLVWFLSSKRSLARLHFSLSCL